MSVAKNIPDFVKRYGEPSVHVPAPPEVVARLAPHLPKVMPEYWHQLGFSVFQNGFFQIVNPETYASAVVAWIKDTELAELDTFHAVTMTAFGELYLWGEKLGRHFTISPMQDGLVVNRDNNEKDIASGKGEVFAEMTFFRIRRKPESLSERLFASAVKRLGPLGPDQMYGFVPALPIGGQIDADNLQIVSAPEHLMMLAGLSERPVIGFDDLVTRAYGKAAVETVKKALDG
ncbi:GAD-like domain-containing protein [Jannaschia pohangensis]|uniref:GAD-related domain-containing protein n=1 Tax=Jannaschia pohangensis TaxID=390807 RepID=A0A1I3NZJ3_9RHOB|nr:GAD-like domain-containing protein [Jannaschia pohangensis]SFJ14512.1 hypothetical protein SAMN04488095_2295 [Jannaschia pohangensis]